MHERSTVKLNHGYKTVIRNVSMNRMWLVTRFSGIKQMKTEFINLVKSDNIHKLSRVDRFGNKNCYAGLSIVSFKVYINKILECDSV